MMPFSSYCALILHMNKINNQIELKHTGISKLFNHYSNFFDEFVVEEFGRKHKADTSFKGHKALMLQIEAYVTEQLKMIKPLYCYSVAVFLYNDVKMSFYNFNLKSSFASWNLKTLLKN